MKTSVFSSTPTVAVRDARGLNVREIQYHRHPDTPAVTDTRITRHQHDIRGVLAHSISPRLYDLMQGDSTVKPDVVYITALAGDVLCTRSVDAGTTLAFNDAAGRPARVISATGTVNTWQYEPEALPGRVLSVTEQVTGSAAHITERFVYAGHSIAEQNLNLAGQNIRHDDPAGYIQLNSLALSGAGLSQSRQLLTGETFVTQTTADATGTVLATTDAMGNTQRVAYDIAGQLKGSWLTLKGGAEQAIVTSLTYSAAGQKLREEHGNGVVTRYSYEPQTQRLIGIKTERPVGHSVGAKVLQDLRYEYDAVGNVLTVKNDAEETRFWRNQKVVPENTYRYDSLYQLVSATGREMASNAQQGNNLPAFVSFDSASYTNYTRTYTYDRGNNLTQISHSAPASGNNHTTLMTVSHRCNRAVLSTFTTDPTNVDALFTPGGEQKQLIPGQQLTWTPRGELAQVTRNGQSSDRESYQYDAGNQRVVKTSVQQSRTQRVVYLPGIELRTTQNGNTQTETENLHTITPGEAGRAQVRVLHWETGKPAAINANNQIRYSYDNLTGSSGLEVDGSGNIISQEEYYPYGGTAVWTARSQTEADYKTLRYSGKERDATGLYYYGYRYYQPWAGRWLSADPAGTVDGLNLYRMVRNNPIVMYDPDGRGCFTCCRGRNNDTPQSETVVQLTPIITFQPQSTHQFSIVHNEVVTGEQVFHLAIESTIPSPGTSTSTNDTLAKHTMMKLELQPHRLQQETMMEELSSKPLKLVNMLKGFTAIPKPALHYVAGELFKISDKFGVSSESQRKHYRDIFDSIAKDIEEAMVTNSPGRALGPVQNAIKKIKGSLSEAINNGYQVDKTDIQTAFGDYLQSLVTEGFENEDTTGTQQSYTSSNWGGHFDYNKKYSSRLNANI